MEEIKKIIDLIDKAIDLEPGNNITEGNIIAFWYDEVVDKYKSIISTSKDWLVWYQADLVKQTWISTLKIKFTWSLWYFIELPKSQINNVLNNFIHKQTLINAGRFVTEELIEFQTKLFEAENNLYKREYEIFLEVREKILDSFWNIKKLSEDTAFIDYTVCLTEVAYYNNFVCPTMTNSYDLKIENWRHPVIEKQVDEFISNDLILKNNDFVHIITWPNMWWKSTFLRQNALIILLAHLWSFIPAKKASIPITDKIFSRVWASDNLFLWSSTFMVEMQEVANILNNSTKNSFVIIDEVWRWTSTYDWMSIAWAILKENHEKIKAKTLFATHYHELIDESKSLSWVSNYSVAVWENEENLVFLRKIIAWGIKKSFWIEVAALAWLSDWVLDEAKKMLKLLELEHNKISGNQLSIWINNIEKQIEYIEKKSEIEEEIKKLDLNSLSPLDALNKLNELKGKI